MALTHPIMLYLFIIGASSVNNNNVLAPVVIVALVVAAAAAIVVSCVCQHLRKQYRIQKVCSAIISWNVNDQKFEQFVASHASLCLGGGASVFPVWLHHCSYRLNSADQRQCCCKGLEHYHCKVSKGRGTSYVQL